MMAPARRLPLEQLEDRIVPVAFNVPWPDAPELTLSFAPDGTAAGQLPSALFQTLDARLPTHAWQLEILRAFQTWAVQANINIGVVADGGQPFGILGLKQGDSRFGDVRIGAFPMADDTLAIADPYDPFVANTWVGDVFLNKSVDFGIGGAGGSYDLFSVLLHEAGHVFGIGPSNDPNSPMFEQHHPTTGLTAADIAELRRLYGVRTPDAFEGPSGNATLETATPLDLSGGATTVEADVTTLQDADVYRLMVPNGATGLDVRLRTSGISLLVPRLTVYDAAGNVVDSALATDPLNNDLMLHLDHVGAGDVYYVKVESGRNDVFGIGAYHLNIDAHLAGALPSSGGAPRPAAGVELLATTPGYVEHTYYEAVGTLSDAAPTHIYRVRSADLGPGLANTMTVAVTAEGDANNRFQAAVYDDQGTRVSATVITDGAGHYEIQVPAVRSDSDYLVVVTTDNLNPAVPYDIVVDFGPDARHLDTFVTDTLDQNTREDLRTLQVVESQQFHFVLSATDWNAPAETGIRMTIADAGGQVVFTLSAADGATQRGDVFLNAGRYTVRFTRAVDDGITRTPVLFQLSGVTLSDSLGPQLRDTTRDPVASADSAALSALSFYWLPFSAPPSPPSRSGEPAPRLDLVSGPSGPSLGSGTGLVSQASLPLRGETMSAVAVAVTAGSVLDGHSATTQLAGARADHLEESIGQPEFPAIPTGSGAGVRMTPGGESLGTTLAPITGDDDQLLWAVSSQPPRDEVVRSPEHPKAGRNSEHATESTLAEMTGPIRGRSLLWTVGLGLSGLLLVGRCHVVSRVLLRLATVVTRAPKQPSRARSAAE